jgi:hypothetical protein
MRKTFFVCFCFISIYVFSLSVQPVLGEKSKIAKEVNQPYLVLITGCGRSGTTYISKLLLNCGLNVPHENLGKDGCASWFLAVDPSADIHFRHIFHQVRHPINVIASVTTFAQSSWDYICKSIPEINKQDSLIVKATKYWIYWNLKAEKRAEWTYRIENLSNEIDEMSRRLGVPLDRNVLQILSDNINTRPHLQLTWEKLRNEVGEELYLQVVEMSRRYGYLESL